MPKQGPYRQGIPAELENYRVREAGLAGLRKKTVDLDGRVKTPKGLSSARYRLPGQRQQQQQPSPQTGGGTPGGGPGGLPSAGAEPPVPGVTGVTPGAVERRLGVPPASLQAIGGAPRLPSEAARNIFSQPEMLQHKPNLLGPSRDMVSNPAASIQALLSQLQRGRGQ